jgi:hypothetical protein
MEQYSTVFNRSKDDTRTFKNKTLCANFLARLQNCEMRLLASLCVCVCPFALNNSASTGWIFMDLYS